MLPESTLNLIAATPDPALQPDPKKSRAAIKRCCAAWQRAYNASLQGTQRTGIDEVFAAHAAGPAYCRAMPLWAATKTSATSSPAPPTASSSKPFPQRGPISSFTRLRSRSRLSISSRNRQKSA